MPLKIKNAALKSLSLFSLTLFLSANAWAFQNDAPSMDSIDGAQQLTAKPMSAN